MPVGSVDLVLFAVRAGVRLGHAARQAYVEQTKQRAISLPLPSVGLDPKVRHARSFFTEEGAEFLDENPLLARLHQAALQRQLGDPGTADHNEYLRLFSYYKSIYLAQVAHGDVQTVGSSPGIDPQALRALLQFEQWDRDDPDRPKPLRRVLGAAVEVGIEYFATVPGAINADTRHRKILVSFVQAVDRLDFEHIALQDDALAQLTGGLLVAALETVGEQSESLASDPNVQELVRVTTHALADDIAARLGDTSLTTHERDSLRAWGDLVFRSLLSSAGPHVLQRPEIFLGIADQPRGELVKRVGVAAINLVTTGSGVQPQKLFSRQGLDTMLSAALLAVADHPELVSDNDNQGVTALIATVARDLGAMPRVADLGLVPEVARLVLSRTADHLELIWPDLEPKNHLLLTAARVTLTALTKEPTAGASWKPRFGREDLVVVLDVVVDELAGNPGWLLAIAQDADQNLKAALDATLRVLRARADERLSPAVGAQVLAESIQAIAQRQKFLEKLPNGKPIIAAAVDAILRELFRPAPDSAASWALLRDEAIAAVVGVSLDALLDSSLDNDALAAVRSTIATRVQAAAAGEPLNLDTLESELAAALLPSP